MLDIKNKTYNVYKYKNDKRIRTKISIPSQLYYAIYERQLCGYGCKEFIKVIQQFIDQYKIEKNVSQSVVSYLISRLTTSANAVKNDLIRKIIVRDRVLETYFINIDNLPDTPDFDLLKAFMNEEYYNLPMVERDKRPKKGNSETVNLTV